MKLINNFSVPAFALLMFAFVVTMTSCSDWTDMETIDQQIVTPDQQSPAEYASYTAKVRAYKKTVHSVVYARIENAPEVSVSGKDFILPLPDSLDFIAVLNSDKLTDMDVRDMRKHQTDFATRMLYYVHVPADPAKLGAYVDQCVSRATQYGFDGFVVASPLPSAEAQGVVVSKLSAVAGNGNGKSLLLEGNPANILPENIVLFDYVVLNTSKMEISSDVRLQVDYVTGFLGIDPAKLIISAQPGTTLSDAEQLKHEALSEMAYNVLDFGPLAGLAVFNVGNDYYHSDGSYYMATRKAISILNPSK